MALLLGTGVSWPVAATQYRTVLVYLSCVDPDHCARQALFLMVYDALISYVLDAGCESSWRL